MSKNFEYPYPTHTHKLNLSVKSEPVIESGTIQDDDQLPLIGYDLYDNKAESFKFNFLVNCPSIDKSLYEMVININGAQSFARLNLPCDNINNDDYHFAYEFNKKDWVGDVKIQALLVLKDYRTPAIGMAFKKGQKYGYSKEIVLRFTEPKETSGSGKNLKISWVNFKTSMVDGRVHNHLKWLRKHKSDLYAIDYDKPDPKSNFPLVYLNENMDSSHKKLLKNRRADDNTAPTKKRAVLFNKIASEVTMSLVMEALTSLRTHTFSEDVLNLNDAWEVLEVWEKNVLEQSSRLLEDISQTNYKDELCQAVNDDRSYKKLIKNFPNKLQQTLKSSVTLKKVLQTRG